MKIIIDFENGMQLTLKPENIQLSDQGDKIACFTRTENSVIPLFFFNGQIATPEEIKAREVAASAKAAAAKTAEPPTTPPAAVQPLTPQPGL